MTINAIDTIKQLKAEWRTKDNKEVIDFASLLENTFKSNYFVTTHGQSFKCCLLSMLVKEIERLDRVNKKWPYCQPFRLTSDVNLFCEDDYYANMQHFGKNVFENLSEKFFTLGNEIQELGFKITCYGKRGSDNRNYLPILKKKLAEFDDLMTKLDHENFKDHDDRINVLAVSPLHADEGAESAVSFFYKNENHAERNLKVSEVFRKNFSSKDQDDIESTLNGFCKSRSYTWGVLNVILIPKHLASNPHLIYPSEPYGFIAKRPLDLALQARIVMKEYSKFRDEILTVRLSDDSKDFMRNVKKGIQDLALRLTQSKSEVYSLRTRPLSSIPPRFNTQFSSFIPEFENDILKYYEPHERGFDTQQIHSRMHVARSLIFCEVMAKYFLDQGKIIDLTFVRRLTGMHDAGREGNGIDVWESRSAHLFGEYLIAKGVPKDEAVKSGQLILKRDSHASLEYLLFQSSDCLDIMRPCTGHGGRAGFKAQFFSFLRDSEEEKDVNFREDLINEAWRFIRLTEELKFDKAFENSQGFMKNLLEVIEKNKLTLPITTSIFC